MTPFPLLWPLAMALLAIDSNKNLKISTIWLVDGNNVLGHKGTPRDREQLAAHLNGMREPTQLVWDGWNGQAELSVVNNGETKLQVVRLPKGQSADDYIVEQVQGTVADQKQSKRAISAAASSGGGRMLQQGMKQYVQVVTADRNLRRRVRSYGALIDVTHPVTFWKRYRPRLCNLKRPESGKVESGGQ